MQHSYHAVRNSSIELLRLFSMLMIVAFHFIVMSPDTDWLNSQPFSFNKVIYQTIFVGGGWIGNFIFFAISAWFLLDKTLTLRDELKRIWLLERELLFWSLLLLIIYSVFNKTQIISVSLEKKYYIKSLLPLTTDLWWYPTSYALYILLLPFLMKGIKALGYKLHKQLAIIVLIIWGIVSFIPKINFDLTTHSVFVFIYWFILLSFYRWYMKPLTSKQASLLIASGIGINLVYYLLWQLIGGLTSRGINYSTYLFTRWSLTTMMIGFGLFLLCLYHPFYNKFVNVIAKSAFGIYLISSYPISVQVIGTYLPLKALYLGSSSIAIACVCILIIFFSCLILDLLRQALFRVTVNKRPGLIFDTLYLHIIKYVNNLVRDNGDH